MDADAHWHLEVLAKGALRCSGTTHGVQRAVEDAERPVAQVLDDAASNGRVLLVQDGGIPVALRDGDSLVFLHERGEADHVREHDRDQLATRLGQGSQS